MAFRKFTRSEKTTIVDPKKVQTELNKLGKRSVDEMDEEERKKFAKGLEK